MSSGGEKKPYRLKSGHSHTYQDETGIHTVEGPAIVHLDDHQAYAFRDKLQQKKSEAPPKPDDVVDGEGEDGEGEDGGDDENEDGEYEDLDQSPNEEDESPIARRRREKAARRAERQAKKNR